MSRYEKSYFICASFARKEIKEHIYTQCIKLGYVENRKHCLYVPPTTYHKVLYLSDASE